MQLQHSDRSFVVDAGSRQEGLHFMDRQVNRLKIYQSMHVQNLETGSLLNPCKQ